MSDEHTARIRALNDRLRRFHIGGRTLLTPGISARSPAFILQVIGAIRVFDDFSEANDPYGEHDFGAIEVDGTQVFFKIDYYNLDLNGGCENPADEAVCARVLTIMLAEEY